MVEKKPLAIGVGAVVAVAVIGAIIVAVSTRANCNLKFEYVKTDKNC